MRQKYLRRYNNQTLTFGLRNFKPFKELQKINIKPLTVICGTNNCGKSSLIQSILLLSQSLASSYREFRGIPRYYHTREKIKYKKSLYFEGEFCHLSDYDNTINSYSIDKELEFEFKGSDNKLKIIFSNPKSELLVAYMKSIIYEGDGMNLKLDAVLNKDGLVDSYFLTMYDVYLTELCDNSFELLEQLFDKKKRFLKKLNFIKFPEWECKDVSIIFSGFIPEDILIPNKPLLRLIKEKLEENREKIKNVQNKPDDLKTILERLEKGIAEKERRHFRFYDNFFSITINKSDFLDFFSNIHYIGPLRSDPHRYYQFFDIKQFKIGNRGEFTPQILTLERNVEIPKFYIYDILGDILSFNKYKSLSLKEGLELWSKKLDLPSIDPKKVEQTLFKIMVKLPVGDKAVTLQDVGFGISQILPVYVESLRMEENNTLILEQPEIHLHPSMQSKLADFLLSMAYSGKKFIIETHSEHIINRLCLRIAQDPKNKIKDLISMVFLEPPKIKKEKYEGTIIKELEINKYGEVENWPIGFFDESDFGKILAAAIDKRKRETEEKL
ncbi:MAG: hypothetical protein CEE43_10355 [Promethearchaeota archaeon Loki_b32]|nr:MAG: hypothetical protein CEE43_10355 [Candidatus Lokiarchaeota archaeon Loki_b32]